MKCWETRGCDEEMSSRCPHAVPGEFSPCVGDCNYAFCDRPTHEVATDFALLLDATVDRHVAMKEVCLSCKFFLTNAPRLV